MHPTPEQIDCVVKKVFIDMDNAILQLCLKMQSVIDLAQEQRWPHDQNISPKLRAVEAYCLDLSAIADPRERNTTIGIHNSQDRSYRLAMTGNSRVVFGRRVPNSPTNLNLDPANTSADKQYVYYADIISSPDASKSSLAPVEPVITL